MRPFEPIFPNPHLLTIAGNFWTRQLDTIRFPVIETYFETEPGVKVLVHSQRPEGAARGELIMVHGLEGSSESGYMRSLSQAVLNAGFAAHRFHMRTCGGTAHLANTLYHAGLTSDLLAWVRHLSASQHTPIHLAGFSLGGNVVLKLTGELGAAAQGLITTVCAVSTPIDLEASALRIGKADNWLYERRFVRRMITRALETGRYSPRDFTSVRTIYEIDDRITAPSFGFGTAINYYRTQSANRFLHAIRVPTLVIQAKDDTFIPFEIFSDPAFAANPFLKLIATESGGHLGFLSKHPPRFWVDEQILRWITTDHARTAASTA